ncbi:MAG TPA: amidohydrolase [Acidimicrobiales bacterium]|nr:amidohydrolase [Acidimicrobiales bacterium]
MPETATPPADGLKRRAEAAVDASLPDLVRLSHDIHDHPELSYQEVRSSALAAAALERGGFAVTTGTADLPTAFTAEVGSGPLVLAICAEYDALPDIGHACGHNIIAAAAVGAGLGLLPLADELGLTVRVVGTPAEEGGGGKVVMLERGVFDDVHVAMMVHPWPNDRLEATCLAVSHFDVEYTGRTAHASAAPWQGVNAADAMVIAQVALGLLRQQLPPGDQVHGVVTNGGEAANIIPARVTGRFMARSLTLGGLELLEPRVRACFRAGAQATGAEVRFVPLAPDYSHMESDQGLLARYRANAEALGRRFTLDDEGAARPTLSTDMANVSLAVPTIHPLLAIESGGSVNHQPEFAAACITPSADTAVRDGALALAWTAIDAAEPGALRDRLLAGSAG